MSLKDLIIADAKNVFMNTDEMAVTATVAGESFPVVRDVSNDLDMNNAFTNSGIVTYVNRVYFADVDFPTGVEKPCPGMVIIIDDERLQIQSASLESGMWKVDFKTSGNTWGI